MMNTLAKLQEIFVPPSSPRLEVDSRLIEPGMAFVAIPGEHQDGRKYIRQALQAGASLVIAEAHGLDPEWQQEQRVLAIADPVATLASCARQRRRSMQGRVVAFTGSNGKTTTRRICANLLATCHTVTQIEGNRNSLIGLPLSMLNTITADEDFHVLELGMSKPGEMDRLVAIAEPDAGCVTNVHPAHLEGTGSIATIAHEKAALYRWLASNGGLLLVNEDDQALKAEIQTEWRRSTYSLERCELGADQYLEITGQDELARWLLVIASREVCLPLPGRAYFECAFTAAAMALALGLDPEGIAAGLAQDPGGEGRMRPRKMGAWMLLDDSYNANPMSMIAALETLAAINANGAKITLLGGMEELGDFLAEGHRQVAAALRKTAPDLVLLKGEHAGFDVIKAELAGSGIALCRIDSAKELQQELNNYTGGVLLAKGSRSAGLDKLLTGLERLEAAA